MKKYYMYLVLAFIAILFSILGIESSVNIFRQKEFGQVRDVYTASDIMSLIDKQSAIRSRKDEFSPVELDTVNLNGKKFETNIDIIGNSDTYDHISSDGYSLSSHYFGIKGWSYDSNSQLFSIKLDFDNLSNKGFQIMNPEDMEFKNGSDYDSSLAISLSRVANVSQEYGKINETGLFVFGSDVEYIKCGKGALLDCLDQPDFAAKMTPQSAKALAENLALHIEGKFKEFKQGRVIACNMFIYTNIQNQFCAANVKIEKAYIFDKKNNNIIQKLDYLTK